MFAASLIKHRIVFIARDCTLIHARQALYTWLTPSNVLSNDFWDCILASCPGRPWAWDWVWTSHLSSPQLWACMHCKVQTYFCIKIHGNKNHYIFLNLTLINCPLSFFSGSYWWRGWRKRHSVIYSGWSLLCVPLRMLQSLKMYFN